MRRFVQVGCAAALGIALSTTCGAAAIASAPAAAAVPAWQPSIIVVWPGHSIQAAVNRVRPNGTVVVKPGVYRQSVVIRKNGVTLLGSGQSREGTVLRPPHRAGHSFCDEAFGPTGICILARQVDPTTGRVLQRVHDVTVTNLRVAGFGGSGVFGFGTSGMVVTHVTAINDGGYGISRFRSSSTLFAWDTAIGNDEAGFYVGDSPHAGTVVRHNVAIGNQFGIFIRHARHVKVFQNLVTGNCQGILVLDDAQSGGAGNTTIWKNAAIRNNKLCPAGGESPIAFKGGGILLVGATHTRVLRNALIGNRGGKLNSGGIVVVSAEPVTHGSAPRHDLIARNFGARNKPAAIIWDGTGVDIRFVDNHCGKSIPGGLCHRH